VTDRRQFVTAAGSIIAASAAASLGRIVTAAEADREGSPGVASRL
jgi:hypothetical protein